MSGARDILRGLCPPFVCQAARKLRSGPESRQEAELARIRGMPRHTTTRARLVNWEFQVPDGPSFAGMFESYFVRQEYQFPISGDSPLIIDGGANVGVGVHYWKHLCPGARVIAFEPDVEVFAALKANCSTLPGVVLQQRALWIENTRLEFAAVGADGGHLAGLVDRKDKPRKIEVEAVRLRDLLDEPVELLKLDIEGAEIEVLEDCADRLENVAWIFVEYHSFVARPQRLSEVLRVLEEAGFRIYCRKDGPARQPFMNRPVYNAKDFHLNIFGYRPAKAVEIEGHGKRMLSNGGSSV